MSPKYYLIPNFIRKKKNSHRSLVEEEEGCSVLEGLICPMCSPPKMSVGL